METGRQTEKQGGDTVMAKKPSKPGGGASKPPFGNKK